MKMKKSFLLLMGFLFLSSVLLAQMPGQEPLGRERMRENINRLRLLRMTEVVELTEEQTAKIYPASYRIEKEKMEIVKTLSREIRDLKAFLGEVNPKEDELAAKVKTVKELRRKLLEKDQEFEDLLEQSLTEIQKARYVIFSVEFYKNLGEKLNRARMLSKEKREY